MESLVVKFEAIGLTPEKAKETAENKKLGPLLDLAITSAKTELEIGPLLYQLASTIKNSVDHLPFIAKQIGDRKLKTQEQVQAAIKFCEKKKNIVVPDFEEACGVGVEITREQVKEKVVEMLAKSKADLEKKRYQMAGMLLGSIKRELKWANPLDVKEELDSQLLSILGPKDERDDPKNLKKQAKESQKSSGAAAAERTIEELAKSEKFIFEGELSKLHKPGENPQINEQLMKDHLKRTGGRVVTRFPPEPNGFLHIGHAKAININFGYAKALGGITYLRYDDTNPEAEEDIYFSSILDTVKWLGFEPFKITYSSDHFQKLYELAIELIKKDKAYICFCTGEEIHAHRGGSERGPRTACKHRSLPIETSLAEFEKMKQGKYEEGVVTLRMKMDLENPNPQFWDLVAYRVLYTHHQRTGDKWCIYPTYDYTHCLCDSFEDITHSLCTTEFQLSRESYYWLVDALELYKPVQWEYGRLSLTNTVLSKRKLNALVTDGHVSGWDDPRMFTISAIRRRGFTPEAVNAFVRENGVTTANTIIDYQRLESYVRNHLNQIAPRLFLLQEPLLVTLVNVPNDFSVSVTIPGKLKGESDRILVLGKRLFIDSSDFRENDDADFFRLAPGKSVGLMHAPFPITCTGFQRDNLGKIIGIEARYENELEVKPKTFLQWLPVSAPKVTLRLYSNLFKSENPSSNPSGWLADLNPDSLKVVTSAMCEPLILDQMAGYSFQAVRVGYFCVDVDSSANGVILNRTVTLKEPTKKS